MAALAAVATDDLPDSQREQVASFNSHARAVAQLLNAASEDLERQDLDTARQSFLEAFQRYENQTASQGLRAVTLATQFNDALAKGDLAAASGRLTELAALDRFPGLAEARRAEFEVANQAERVEQALKTQDFVAAEAALARLRELDAGSRRIGELQHQVTLQQRTHAFDRALQAKDLAAATTALAGIKEHDGERETWRQANQRLAASRLQEDVQAARIAEREQVVRSLLAAERPDFTQVDAALAAFVAEAGDGHPSAQILRQELAARRAGLAIADTLGALDQAVLGGQADRVQLLVAAEAHAEALASLIGQEGLELEHRILATQVDGAEATVEVDLRTAMKVYPEAIIRYRYRMQRGDDGWLVIAAERLAKQ
jgi:hypothetical protein